MEQDIQIPLPRPKTRDLVLIGGGHTHALVLRKWGMSPLPGARLTLINPGSTAAYSGMLPGHIAGHYSRHELDIDLIKLARFAQARIILAPAMSLNIVDKVIDTPGRAPVAYDVASIDVGITSEMPKLVGFSDFGVPAKPLGTFATAWSHFLARDGLAQVAILGAGVAGIELALAMSYSLTQTQREKTITVIDRGEALAGVRKSVARRLRAKLAQEKVQLIEHSEISHVDGTGVALDNGCKVAAKFVCGAAGAKPHDWIVDTGLETQDGFLTVGPTLQTSDPNVFAVGDCAFMAKSPRPKAGVYAVRQAPVLYENLRTCLRETGSLQTYQPQSDYLKLISLGEKHALGDRFGVTFSGSHVWKLKNRIDRAFMDKLSNFPAMPFPKMPDEHSAGLPEALGAKPMCGGCGAKLGQDALSFALENAPAVRRSDITRLPGDDAAVLQIGGATQVVSTDHLRQFVEDPVVMTRITAVHALGDIWAMGAAPQAATANVILPPMSPELAARSLREIMTTAHEMMQNCGAEIVGGHSSHGSEMTLGFTVTGLCENQPITLGGARVGDALILTKPIGSGVIMAGEMAYQSQGEWVEAALHHMCMPQSKAAVLLSHANAMTDVTGFGLIGHVRNICDRSGVGARLNAGSVPLLPGALDLARSGVRSSLFGQNKRGFFDVSDDPVCDLLFDPQTAGGLLASVSQPVDALLSDLRDAGFEAAVIGEVTNKSHQIEVV